MKTGKKKAFTFLELTIVITVLGILVLVAAPRLTGYLSKAQTAHIKADVKNMETKIASNLINNEDFTKLWLNVSSESLEKYKENGFLYSKKRVLDDKDELESNNFKKVPNSSNILKTNLKGDFIYGEGGEVYYYDSVSSSENGYLQPEPGKPIIPYSYDSNFEWIDDDLGYYSKSKGTVGYYRYIGNEETVVIPKTIDKDPITSYYRMFYKSDKNIKKIISTNKNVTIMNSMFFESNSEYLDLTALDTSNVKSMYAMFYYSKSKEIDVSKFDTSNVSRMGYMFFFAQAEKIDVSGFDTSNVTSMNCMFYNSQSSIIDVSNFDTSNVSDMNSMFYKTKAKEIDVSNFKTSKVINMFSMFAQTQAEILDVSRFDTSNVTSMSEMFFNAKSKIIDVSNFKTSNVRTMSRMFTYSKAEILDVSGFDTSKVTSMTEMFASTTETKELDVSNFNVSNAIEMGSMFASASAKEIDIRKWVFNPIIDRNRAFISYGGTIIGTY